MTIRFVRRVSGRFIKLVVSAEGNTAIEFAVVLPIMLLFVFSIIGFGFVIFESAVLQGALNTASREGKTGFPNTGDAGNECTGGVCIYDKNGNIKNLGPRWQEVQSIMQNETKALFNPADLTFTATAYPDFITLEQSSGTGTASDVGGSGQVVVYTASYPCPAFLLSLIGLKNVGNITAYNIVKNEGF